MEDLKAEIEFLKNKVDTLEIHLEELKKYYFTTRELDGLISKYHSIRLHKLDNSEF
jgi:ribosomal protein S15P/S13E